MRLIKFEPGTVFGEKSQRRYSQGPLRRIAKVTTPMVRWRTAVTSQCA